MAIPDYMLPLDGETEEQHQTRLFIDFLYARGGNHPGDVARWKTMYTGYMLAQIYLETWGRLADDEQDYVPADPDIDDEIFEVIGDGFIEEAPEEVDRQGRIPADSGLRDQIFETVEYRADKNNLSEIDSRKIWNVKAVLKGKNKIDRTKRYVKLADKRTHAERHGVTLEKLAAIAEKLKRDQ